MTFADRALARSRPRRLRGDVVLPRRQQYHPSPHDWRDEVLYFLLVDRFSDGSEDRRPLLDRANLAAARPNLPNGEPWRWDRWAESGANRWQGGTLRGVTSKLDYLRRLGITTIWLSPVFRQRGHLDSYHGYGIQDFLDVDPRLGTRADLVDLVSAAHDKGMRIILDIIFNHSGSNWDYPPDTPGGPHQPIYTSGAYRFGSWLGADGQPVPSIATGDDGVWPVELQDPDRYSRAGSGDLGAGDIDDPFAEHKRSDFLSLRDFRLAAHGLLTDLAGCFKYWMAMTDCDGFRIDTLKHVSLDEARHFCDTIKEFAMNLGKTDFFLVGEVAGGDYAEDRYLDLARRNLNATLDIGGMRLALSAVAKGLAPARAYFEGFDPGKAVMGSHRSRGNQHVSILDDHDHVFGPKLRFSVDAASDHQVVAAVALQMLTLGIPCVYYGTEQALAGPEPEARRWLPDWTGSDRYLREAMFGPLRPRAAGRAGLAAGAVGLDPELPGFGPCGTAGQHAFDEGHPAYRRIAAIAAARRDRPVLRFGRQYERGVSMFGGPFAMPGAGELAAWSRVLDDEEALCIVNTHGTDDRGGEVFVDAELNPPGTSMTSILETASPDARPRELPVRRTPDGAAYVELRDVAPSEVVILSNHPGTTAGDVLGQV